MAYSKQKPRKNLPHFKISQSESNISQYNDIRPVTLSVVQNLTDHTEIQVNGHKIMIYINELENINNLGEGKFGIVDKMIHRPSNLIFAIKKIRCSMDDKEQSRILNDLNISMRSSQCPYVVVSYGAMFQGGDVWICMEFLDISLDKFYRKVQEINKSAFIPEKHLAYITFCVVTALEYLHKELKVIHRDVKPSNILIDKFGRVKVCDFGISGTLINSISNTNIGSQSYLAPERISSDENSPGYTIRSDVWSLGLTVLELALCKYPYSSRPSLYDQIVDVVEHSPPTLSKNSNYSKIVSDFISKCLVKAVDSRASYVQLLKHDMLKPFKKNQIVGSLDEFGLYVTQIIR